MPSSALTPKPLCSQPPSTRRDLLIRGAAACALALPAAARAQSEARLLLGQSVPLTGPAALLGRQYVKGAQLVFERVNARGGVARRPIELRVLDDGYEADRCAANTQSLIRDEVFALFGYVGTPTSLAALPLLSRAGVPLVAPCTGAAALREPFNRQVFLARASYRDEATLIVRQLWRGGARRIALLRQADSYGVAGLDALTRALAAQGLSLLGQASVERNSLDVSAAVHALMPLRPDAVVLVCTYQASAAFVRAARKTGFAGQFANVSFVGTQALADALGRDGAGVLVSQVMPSPYHDAHPLAAAFRAAAREAGGRVQPNYSSLEGFFAASLLVAGLEAAARQGRLSRDSLVAGLESLGRRELMGFPIELGPTRHTASDFVTLSRLVGDGSVAD